MNMTNLKNIETETNPQTVEAQKNAALRTDGQNLEIVVPRDAIITFSSQTGLFNTKANPDAQTSVIDLSLVSEHGYEEINKKIQGLLAIREDNGFDKAHAHVLRINGQLAYVPPQTLTTHPKGQELHRTMDYFNNAVERHAKIEPELLELRNVEGGTTIEKEQLVLNV